MFCKKARVNQENNDAKGHLLRLNPVPCDHKMILTTIPVTNANRMTYSQ